MKAEEITAVNVYMGDGENDPVKSLLRPKFVTRCYDYDMSGIEPPRMESGEMVVYSIQEQRYVRLILQDGNLRILAADDAPPSEPRNNDGLESCHWCDAPTKKVDGVSAVYDVCTKCGR